MGDEPITMIRLVAIDLDGTLLDSHWQVPEANRRALERAIERGIHIVLVTGRRFSFTHSVTEQLHDDIALIVNNGALIKSPEGETLMRRLLPREIACAVIEATREYRAGTALVFDRPVESQIVFERIDWNDPGRRGYFERNRQYLKEICPLEASLTEDPIQVMYTGPVGEMRRLVAALRGLDFASDFSLAVAEYEARDFTIVDVIERSCSKGNALREWAERLGIGREEIFAIGDNLNDREMLEFAGQAVVMGNAATELKTLGWPVTLSNDDGGVAAAIEKYVLAEAKP
jgi:Cof subfamily protein (haloacid dehalogenase superfamily)